MNPAEPPLDSPLVFILRDYRFYKSLNTYKPSILFVAHRLTVQTDQGLHSLNYRIFY